MKTEEVKYTLYESGLIKEEIKTLEYVVPEEIKVSLIDLSGFKREIEQLEIQKSDLTIRRDELIASYVNPIDQLNAEITKLQEVIDKKKEKIAVIETEVPEVKEEVKADVIEAVEPEIIESK